MGGAAPQHRKQQGAEHPQTHLSPALDDKEPCGKKQAEGQKHKTGTDQPADALFQPQKQKAGDPQQAEEAEHRHSGANAGIDLPPGRHLLPGGLFLFASASTSIG